MSSHYLISLCIPTNGIQEFVFPVLDSIYSQNIDESLFEVIITDNGNNDDFENEIQKYLNEHDNMIYKRTDAVQFLNQIESFKLAHGRLIKFVNHRFVLQCGALNHLLHIENKFASSRPVIYFSNGNLNHYNVRKFKSFDLFVRSLLYWSSWSAGIAVWKDDFDKIDPNLKYNSLFPHTDLLFHDRNKDMYVIDDTRFMKELSFPGSSKGRYKLFQAFGEEYPSIIESLYFDGDISKKTFRKTIHANGLFLGQLYYLYVIMHLPCSYDLSDSKKYISKYYNMPLIYVYGIESYIYEKLKESKSRRLKK